ncbi:MAG: polymer-forming cytoskeletal protein [Thermoanaerobaculia bacterium]
MAVFGKTESNRVSTPAPGEPASPPTTVLGSGARFVGDLSGDEDIVVNGHFEGRIRVDRSTVTVGTGGQLDGDIAARSVVVGGKVRGQITANEKAELLESAIVEGSVQAPKVVIAEGAQLEGNVAMSSSHAGGEE